MAITGSYNLDNALDSQSYAYKCWYNYYYGNNTLGITAKDMGEITQTWKGEVDNWRAVALDDENAYEIEDDDYSAAMDSGRNNAVGKTGYDGDKTFDERHLSCRCKPHSAALCRRADSRG